jgi:hypothetical protein
LATANPEKNIKQAKAGQRQSPRQVAPSLLSGAKVHKRV